MVRRGGKAKSKNIKSVQRPEDEGILFGSLFESMVEGPGLGGPSPRPESSWLTMFWHLDTYIYSYIESSANFTSQRVLFLVNKS
jgi:hypothetical protein